MCAYHQTDFFHRIDFQMGIFERIRLSWEFFPRKLRCEFEHPNVQAHV